MVIEDITFLLNQFISCEDYENIIFCWVMDHQEIIDDILSRLNLNQVQVIKLSLIASKTTLKQRILSERSIEDYQRSKLRLPLYASLRTIKVNTDDKSIEDVVSQILMIIERLNNPLQVKGLIFDFNGTLFVDSDKHKQAWDQISQLIRGYGIKDDELQQLFHGVPNQYIIQYLKGNPTTNEEINRYSSLKEQYYRDLCKADQENFHLISGVEAFLDHLTIPHIIASASIKDNMDFFNQSFHLSDWFNPNVSVYDDGSYQNKIAMFQEAAKRIGVSLQDCIIFEDSIRGIQNAYEAGCNQIIVIDSENRGNDFYNLPGIIGIYKDFDSLFI